MSNVEPAVALFNEIDPDSYILTSEESVVLGAAWKVLQAFELSQDGQLKFYDESSRDSTLDYLCDGGEERPHSGIFAVEVQDSFDEPNMTDLFVTNRNGRGDEAHRSTLRAIVATVGIQHS